MVASTARKPAGVASRGRMARLRGSSRPRTMPALLTRMSRRPNSHRTSSASRLDAVLVRDVVQLNEGDIEAFARSRPAAACPGPDRGWSGPRARHAA